MILSSDFARTLNLHELSPSTKTEWEIVSADLNRPGMQFCGFYDHFANDRPQVIGNVEMAYLTNRTPEERQRIFHKYFSYDVPCVVICRNLAAPRELLEEAGKRDTAVFSTEITTSKFTAAAIQYLTRKLSPRITKHGVLVEVYGIGVLLVGKSGVGKSEAALELIKRGHQLVADDVVEICKESEDSLVGECPEMVRHFMEIRGIGIIDIRAMFGVGSVTVRKSIDLVIQMESDTGEENDDRLGLEQKTTRILDVDVPYMKMTIRPGRNVAIIIEVAARNLSLNKLGYNAAKKMKERIDDAMRNGLT